MRKNAQSTILGLLLLVSSQLGACTQLGQSGGDGPTPPGECVVEETATLSDAEDADWATKVGFSAKRAVDEAGPASGLLLDETQGEPSPTYEAELTVELRAGSIEAQRWGVQSNLDGGVSDGGTLPDGFEITCPPMNDPDAYLYEIPVTLTLVSSGLNFTVETTAIVKDARALAIDTKVAISETTHTLALSSESTALDLTFRSDPETGCRFLEVSLPQGDVSQVVASMGDGCR